MKSILSGSMNPERTTLGIALTVGVVVALALIASGSSRHGQLFLLFSINVVLAAGLQIFMGLTGIVSLGHVAFMASGAYVSAILTMPGSLRATVLPDAPGWVPSGLDFASATIVAIVVTALFALVVGLAISRLKEGAATIATYALFVITGVVIINLSSLTRGNQTFYGIPMKSTLTTAAIVASLAIIAGRVLFASRLGMMLRAVRDDELAAQSVGLRPHSLRLVAWTLSAGVTAAGGALYAHFVLSLSPNQFSLVSALTILTIVIIGGQTISGALLGTLIVTAVTEFLRRQAWTWEVGNTSVDAAQLTPLVLGVFILAVLVLTPNGVLGRRELEDLIPLRRRTPLTRQTIPASESGGIATPAPPAQTSHPPSPNREGHA